MEGHKPSFDQVILDCYVQSSHLKTERAEQEEFIGRCVSEARVYACFEHVPV